MADPILHIKDSYYFEVPKIIAPANYKHLKDLPKVWVKLDPEFQKWEFEKVYDELTKLGIALPPKQAAEHDKRRLERRHADRVSNVTKREL